MISLSQENPNPKIDMEKVDVFALGIMLVEIIFVDKLSGIYDFENYEIRLNPLLEKLQRRIHNIYININIHTYIFICINI